MQFADEHGIMIIDECPSVNTDLFEPQLLTNHMSALEQLIHRDRNHASVIAWSIANEPRTKKKAAEAYFGYVGKSLARNYLVYIFVFIGPWRTIQKPYPTDVL